MAQALADGVFRAEVERLCCRASAQLGGVPGQLDPNPPALSPTPPPPGLPPRHAWFERQLDMLLAEVATAAMPAALVSPLVAPPASGPEAEGSRPMTWRSWDSLPQAQHGSDSYIAGRHEVQTRQAQTHLGHPQTPQAMRLWDRAEPTNTRPPSGGGGRTESSRVEAELRCWPYSA